ncbi:putative Late nodulin [Medicago truncatula]|uniref:Putative Late nodulin n=1 Tax=Medicago truncatula TaxID=3880 RepID=A0A396HUL1_MEDTR|nr:putative Late nodulin [Medicago truncatula]
MATILKIVYAMILFISLFLVAMNVDAYVECETDADCQPNMCKWPFIVQCYKNVCICVHHTNPYL